MSQLMVSPEISYWLALSHQQIPPSQVDGNLFVSAKDRAERVSKTVQRSCYNVASFLSFSLYVAHLSSLPRRFDCE